MLKRITLILCAALLVGTFAVAATHPAAPAAKITGTIQSIDAAKHTVTVQVGTESRTFTVTDRTSYLVGGKKSKMADLKAGQNVTIEADAKNAAHLIEVTTAPATH